MFYGVLLIINHYWFRKWRHGSYNPHHSTICSMACSRYCSGQQSSTLLAIYEGDMYRWPPDSPHNGLVMRKAFPYHEVIMHCWVLYPSGQVVLLCMGQHVKASTKWRPLTHLLVKQWAYLDTVTLKLVPEALTNITLVSFNVMFRLFII